MTALTARSPSGHRSLPFTPPGAVSKTTAAVLAGACIAPADHLICLGGAQTGLIRGALEQVGPVGTVTTVDPDRAVLRRVRASYRGGRLVRTQADPTRLPAQTRDVHAVIGINILAADPYGVLEEATRVLIPGGRVSLVERVERHLDHNAHLPHLNPHQARAIETALRDASPPDWPGPFTEQALAALVENAGLHAETIDIGLSTWCLTGEADVERYLHRPLAHTSPSRTQVITARFDTEVAQHYERGWHHAVDGHRTVTITAPTLVLTATKP